MLGVPRPTLYRYLKDYSVPYARRSGRIRIPEESVGRIRRVRELHGDGLGADAVRRRLTDGTPELEERLTERLDRICETLQELRGASGSPSGAPPAEIAAPPGAMRTLLARQNLLISAVFDMSQMLEELLAASGRPRMTTFQDALPAETLVHPPVRHDAAVVTAPAPLLPTQAIPELASGRVVDAGPSGAGERFGSLARRRRRAVATVLVLASLTLLVALAWAFAAVGGV